MILSVMIMKKTGKIFYALLLVFIFCMCIADYHCIAKAVTDALKRCLCTLIPSLYAVMTVSYLITESGVVSLFPKWSEKISEKLFGISRTEFFIFSFSMFSGYPVGTRMILSEYKKGRIPKKRAEILCGICCGAGPSFIFGCVSGILYKSAETGVFIALTVTSANAVLMLVMSLWLRKNKAERHESEDFCLSAEMLNESIIESGHTLMNVCFVTTAFSVFSEILSALGFYGAFSEIVSSFSHIPKETVNAFMYSLADITNISRLPKGDYTILPYICGLVSFSGVCVLFQLYSVVSGYLSVKPIIAMRIISAFLSGIICRLILPFYMKYELTAVSRITIQPYSAQSPVPSVMLIIMTLMLFAQSRKNVRYR